MPERVSIEDCRSILTYCLEKINLACVQRQNLFRPYMSKEDLIDEVGVKTWLELRRYRKKFDSYASARNFGFRVAQNCLKSMVRSRLTVTKRGAKAVFVDNAPKGSERPYGMLANIQDYSLSSNGQLMFEAMEHIVTVAVRLIGPVKYALLCRAFCYDWDDDIGPEQEVLLVQLGLTRRQLIKLMRKLGRRVNEDT